MRSRSCATARTCAPAPVPGTGSTTATAIPRSHYVQTALRIWLYNAIFVMLLYLRSDKCSTPFHSSCAVWSMFYHTWSCALCNFPLMTNNWNEMLEVVQTCKRKLWAQTAGWGAGANFTMA
ncbi:hypothetical protein VPH35_100452 [Triticum aestivum]